MPPKPIASLPTHPDHDSFARVLPELVLGVGLLATVALFFSVRADETRAETRRFETSTALAQARVESRFAATEARLDSAALALGEIADDRNGVDRILHGLEGDGTTWRFIPANTVTDTAPVPLGTASSLSAPMIDARPIPPTGRRVTLEIVRDTDSIRVHPLGAIAPGQRLQWIAPVYDSHHTTRDGVQGKRAAFRGWVITEMPTSPLLEVDVAGVAIVAGDTIPESSTTALVGASRVPLHWTRVGPGFSRFRSAIAAAISLALTALIAGLALALRRAERSIARAEARAAHAGVHSPEPASVSIVATANAIESGRGANLGEDSTSETREETLSSQE